MRICTKTVMDETDPEITFDEDGVCNHYYAARHRLETELMSPSEGQRRLADASEKIKENGRGKPYDCIMGLSGGADSSYVAVKAMEYGLRPLVVHLDNGWNTDTAVTNIENLLNHYNLDLHTHVVQWDQFRDIQRSLFLSSVANIEVATDHAIFSLLYHTAARYDVKYILTGSNLETETIMPDAWGYDTRDKKHIVGIKKRFGDPKIAMDTYPMLSVAEFVNYVFRKKIRMVPILNYGQYNKAKAVEEMSHIFGYRSYARKHGESKFTRFFQEYYLPQKFNFDKRKAHLSSQIVSGMITRDAAIELLQQPLYDANELEIDIEFVTKKLGFERDEWDRIIAAPPISFRKYPSNYLLFNQTNPIVKQVREFAKRV